MTSRRRLVSDALEIVLQFSSLTGQEKLLTSTNMDLEGGDRGSSMLACAVLETFGYGLCVLECCVCSSAVCARAKVARRESSHALPLGWP